MDTDIIKLTSSLQEFHDKKVALMEVGACGSLDHWRIPKLKMMLAVVLSISSMGALGHGLQMSLNTLTLRLSRTLPDLETTKTLTCKSAATLIIKRNVSSLCKQWQSIALTFMGTLIQTPLTVKRIIQREERSPIILNELLHSVPEGS